MANSSLAMPRCSPKELFCTYLFTATTLTLNLFHAKAWQDQLYLVCNIKERHVVLLLTNISNLLPLLWCWVNASWVMCTSMKQYNRSIRCILRHPGHPHTSQSMRTAEHWWDMSHKKNVFCSWLRCEKPNPYTKWQLQPKSLTLISAIMPSKSKPTVLGSK